MFQKLKGHLFTAQPKYFGKYVYLTCEQPRTV